MSHVIEESPASSDPLTIRAAATPVSASWLDSFLQSFFQEKNIKWMLIVGAAIVFGSSLMLVNKAWPDWSPALKYLTIVGYSGVIFCAAEISRRRLNLSSTSVVLQALTLLLLPVCFLSLTWLSSGSAMQTNMNWLRHTGLLIPAVALLWIASKTILDHWLRGRQTSFLFSFCILCVAGAMPPLSNAITAFAFVAACWLVLTAGITKVNRHTFWLAEQQSLPRIFGFLPIAMLGLQFIILVGVKSAAALPPQWIGFAIVMLSATVLMTTRSVAEVFRKRTGDLVRPMPWSVVIPLFSGLVLLAIGVVLSMAGFTYVGSTTYAVIPASIVAAMLLSQVARDTRHSGFVWATLIVTALAYQCSPVLFADVVHSLKDATADAIRQKRVPLTMYGLTYLPLLGVLAFISRRFENARQVVFSRPIQQFVTTVSIALLAVAMLDLVPLNFISPFLVATANAVAFVVYAIVFRDRRYAMLGVVAGLMGCATSIPALTQMQYLQLPSAWIPTLMAGVAVAMTALPWLDSLYNRIPVASGDRVSRRTDGSDRQPIQWTGFALAVGMGVHWIVTTAMAFDQSLSLSAILQFTFLIAALVRFTLASANYLSAAGVWVFAGYAALRWAAGLDVAPATMVSYGTFALIVVSLTSLILAKPLMARLQMDSLGSMRRSLGFKSGGRSKAVAFVLPLFDLSTVFLSTLIAVVHVPAVVIQHAALIGVPFDSIIGFGWSTTAALAWLFVMGWAIRNEVFSLVGTMVMPLVASGAMIAGGSLSGVLDTLLLWAVVQGLTAIVCDVLISRRGESKGLSSMVKVSQWWLAGLLAISCFSLAHPMRIIAAIALLSLAVSLKFSLGSLVQRRRGCALAIAANVQLLWLVASLLGCSGWLLFPSTLQLSVHAVPWVFLTASLSALVFQTPHRRIACDEALQWATTLRVGTIPLIGLAMLTGPDVWPSIIAMTLGFAVLVAIELRSAMQTRQEARVWGACGIAGLTALFLWTQDVFSLGMGVSQLVMLGLAVACLTVSHLSCRDSRYSVFTRPLRMIGQSLPAVVACLAIVREFSGSPSSLTALNALSLMMAAGLYFHQSAVLRRPWLSVLAMVIANAAVFLLWNSLHWTSPELYLIPVGVSILGFAELMKHELPRTAHTPLHYIGLLTVLCSPIPEVLGGSWIHMLALMLISVIVILAAIGLRTRSLIYAGSAFLLTDLVAMVVRSTVHNVDLLWICGVVLGVSVIALAAFCENHREKLLSRIRMLSAELATWN